MRAVAERRAAKRNAMQRPLSEHVERNARISRRQIPMTARNEKQPTRSLTDAIVGYYDETWLDYRILWLNPDNLAVHFGYTDQSTRSHTDALKNMNRVLADRVQIQSGERVLDAGCGVGGSSFWLAKERGAEVVGITLA
ncbi:MAG: SAM-dependent methyltransferase, partial [Candidatus Dormibacteria bacterium]